MQLHSLRLQGFKKFRDQPFIFEPGLNIFTGPNEVGKTSIHQGLVTALYGLGAKTSGLLKKDVLNWHGTNVCRVVLEYTLDGTLYQLQRDILQRQVSLHQFSPRTKAFELVNEDRKQVNKIVGEHIGITNPSVFNYTISVKQSDLIHIENLAEVSQAIERVFTGQDALSPDDIRKNLNSMRKTLKKQRNEKPGKIDEFEENLENVKQQLEQLQVLENERLMLEEEVKSKEGLLPKKKETLASVTGFLEKWDLRQTTQKRFRDLQKQYMKLESKLKQYDEQADLLSKTKQDLKKFEKVLAHKEKISEYKYLFQRMKEIDTKIASLMGKKAPVEESVKVVEKKQQLKKMTAMVLLPVLLIDFFVTLLAIVNDWQMVYLGGGSVGLFLLAVWMLIILLPTAGKKVNNEHFRQLIQERNEVIKKLIEISKIWGFKGEETQFGQVLNTLQLLEKMQQTIEKKEVALEALLGDENKISNEKELIEMKGKLADLKEDLLELQEFSPDIEKVENWKNRKEKLSEEVPRLREHIKHVQGRLLELRKQKKTVQELEATKEYIEQELSHLRFQYQAVELAIETFDEVIDGYNAVYIPTLQQRSSSYFSKMTKGRYSLLDLSTWPAFGVYSSGNLGYTNPEKLDHQLKEYSFGQNLVVDAKAPQKGKKIHPESLSQGTIDQLYFALRLGASELLSKDKKLPLFLDDPFVHYDASRLQETLDLLAVLAQYHQILYFTHNDRILQQVEQLQIPHNQVKVIDLEGM